MPETDAHLLELLYFIKNFLSAKQMVQNVMISGHCKREFLVFCNKHMDIIMYARECYIQTMSLTGSSEST